MVLIKLDDGLTPQSPSESQVTLNASRQPPSGYAAQALTGDTHPNTTSAPTERGRS
jgi:hypothetical protein